MCLVGHSGVDGVDRQAAQHGLDRAGLNILGKHNSNIFPPPVSRQEKRPKVSVKQFL